jgi:hypothetical protein
MKFRVWHEQSCKAWFAHAMGEDVEKASAVFNGTRSFDEVDWICEYVGVDTNLSNNLVF